MVRKNLNGVNAVMRSYLRCPEPDRQREFPEVDMVMHSLRPERRGIVIGVHDRPEHNFSEKVNGFCADNGIDDVEDVWSLLTYVARNVAKELDM